MNQTIFPHIFLNDSRKALGWYKHNLDAEIRAIHDDPATGRVMHASFYLSKMLVMAADMQSPNREIKVKEDITSSTISLYIYLDSKADVDRVCKQAKDAGAVVFAEPVDMFWGDYWCYFADPFGIVWQFAKMGEGHL